MGIKHRVALVIVTFQLLTNLIGGQVRSSESQLLTKNSNEIFDVLFLDLNMPRKNGFACLEEIKLSEQLKSLPVIVFSTSYDQSVADLLNKNGVQYYICKPADFSELKEIIQQALMLIAQKSVHNTQRKFLIQ